MTKAARCLAFALKPAQPFGVAPHFRRQDFDRHAVAQQDMAGAIDGAHTAFAQHGFDLILAVEGRADQRRRILFQDFAVFRAEAYAVVEFFVAGRAVLHAEVSLQRSGEKSVPSA